MTRQELAGLVRLAAGGDDAAWELIVNGHEGLVWHVIRGYRLGDADAADVAQSTWLHAITGLGRLTAPEALPSWLCAIARHECLRLLRRRPLLYGDGLLEHLMSLDDGTPGPEGELIAAEEARELRQAIASLPGRQRQLMEMLAADASYDDVTRALGMPVGSIGPMRMRAAARVRDELARAGVLER